jgi:hypothetical protein
MDPGDVTGFLVGTLPGETHRGPLAGGRVSLRYTNMQRTSGHDGRFTLRGLPKGDHVLLMSYDPDGDRVPNLVGVLKVPVHVDSNQERARVNLGEVELLKPATIRGTLVPPALDPTCVDISAMRAFIDDTDVQAAPDAAGRFVLRGLGEFDWKLVAAGGGALAELPVTVKSGEDVDVGEVTVRCGVPLGDLWVDVNTPEGVSALAQPLGTRAARACSPQLECWDATQQGNQFQFSQLPVGGYSVEVDVGDAFLRLHHEFVLVAGGRDPRLLTLTATPLSGTVLDLDGDGFPAFPDPAPDTCRDTCRRELLTNRLATCEQWDCDDDGDGQSDLDERGYPGNPGCHCGPGGMEPDGPSCENDPSRYDLDFNGTCDIYEQPLQASSSSSSASGTSSSGGGSSMFPSSSATSGQPSSSATSRPVPSSSGAVVTSSSSGTVPVDTLIAGPFPTGSITSMAVGDDFLAWVDAGGLWACQLSGLPCSPFPLKDTGVLHVAALKNSTVVWSEAGTATSDATLHQCSIAPGLPACLSPTQIFTAGPPSMIPAPGFKGVFAANKETVVSLPQPNLFLAIDDVDAGYIQGIKSDRLTDVPLTFASIPTLTFADLAVEPAPNMRAGVAWVRSDTGGGVEGCNAVGCGVPNPTVFITRAPAERVAFAANRVFWVDTNGSIVTCTRADAMAANCANAPAYITGAQAALAVDTMSNLYWVKKGASGDASIMRRNVP